MVEIYRDVVGHEEYFQISNLGNLYSKRTRIVLKQTPNKNGYLQVSTKIGGRLGRAILLRIHRVVAEAHLSPPSERITESAKNTKYGKVPINHKDGNKKNNKVENLEWCTYQENTMHAIDNGLRVYPEIRHGSTLAYKKGCRCDLCKGGYSKTRKSQYLRTGK